MMDYKLKYSHTTYIVIEYNGTESPDLAIKEAIHLATTKNIIVVLDFGSDNQMFIDGKSKILEHNGIQYDINTKNLATGFLS